MARSENLDIHITASDDASRTIDRLERRVDGLESDEARIVVTAETDRLERQLDRARAKLEGLSGDEATVQARLVGSLEQDLADARRLFDQLDGQTGTVRIDADVADADAAVGSLLDQLDAMPGKIADISAGLRGVTSSAAGTGGVAAAIGVGVVGGLISAANAAADFALESKKLAELTGSTVEETSRLVSVWESFSGGEANDLADIMVQVNSALTSTPELAARLGVNLADGASGAERFVEVVERLNTVVADVSERQNIGSQLFGEEGIRQVAQLTSIVGDDLAPALDRAREATAAQAEAAADLKLQTADMSLEFQKFATAVGSWLIPAADKGLSALNGLFDAAERWGAVQGDFFFGGNRRANRDLVDEFEAAEAAAADWIATNLAGIDSQEQLDAALARTDLPEHARNLARVALANRDAATTTDEVADAADDAAGSIDTYAGSLDAALTPIRAAQSALVGVRDTLRQVRDEAIGRESSFLDIADQLDRIADANQRIVDAETDPERQRAMRDLRREQLRLTEQLYDYLDGLDDIPASKSAEIRTLIDQGSYDEVVRQLDALSDGDYTRLALNLEVGRSGAAVTLGPGKPIVTHTAPPTTVNIYNPPGTPAATAANFALFVKRNGARADG